MKLSLLHLERAPVGMEVRITAEGIEIDFGQVPEPAPAPAMEVTHRWVPDEPPSERPPRSG